MSHVPWAEIKDPWNFPYTQKLISLRFCAQIWHYVQPASQPQTTCKQTSPGPPHPASSPPGSSEISHLDRWWNWGVFLSVIKTFCGEKLILIGWAWLTSGWVADSSGPRHVLIILYVVKPSGFKQLNRHTSKCILPPAHCKVVCDTLMKPAFCANGKHASITSWEIQIFAILIMANYIQLVVTVFSHFCSTPTDSGEVKVESHASSKTHPAKPHCFLTHYLLNPEARRICLRKHSPANNWSQLAGARPATKSC
jgi:hypothetical protein